MDPHPVVDRESLAQPPSISLWLLGSQPPRAPIT